MQKEISIEVSARHVHLSQADIEALFGEGAELTNIKDIAGGFVAAERLTLVGPKKSLQRVAILGPARKETQIELSLTDARTLGLADVPIRLSGKLDGTPGMKIIAENGTEVEVDHGVMIAQRHVHVSDEDGAALGLEQNQNVTVVVDTGMGRKTVFDDCPVRIGGPATVMHIDTDEGNAACTGRACTGIMICE